MKENFLVDLSKQFAVDIVNLCTDIKENRKSNVLLNQVLRSGTSIGANIHEANYAASKADFINKFQIALKECYETDYWLGLFKDTHMITEEEYKDMFAKCSKIRKLLIASITTAKENNLNPQDVLFVGDSLTDDVIGPKSVGMKTALVDRAKRRSFAEQDYTFTELTDLLKTTEL